MGNIYSNIGNFQQAQQFYLESIHNFEKIGDIQKAANMMSNLAEVLIFLKDFAQAKKYADESAKIYQKLQTNFYLIEPYLTLFRIALYLNDEQEALRLFSNMMELRNKYPSKIEDVYLKLANLQLVVRFQDLASLKDFLTLGKEIYSNSKSKIEFKIHALISMAQIISSKMLIEENLEYIEILKEFIVQMQTMAKKSYSYFILANTYLIEANIAYLDNDSEKLTNNLEALDLLNAKLKLDIFKEEIELLKQKTHPKRQSALKENKKLLEILKSINDDMDRMH